uniref:Reverse transcriptase domain-containing protein n=1 Tax=Strongyloides venezuelensis TaxID=75913 RepID=A0A0K0FSZ5_STRVS
MAPPIETFNSSNPYLRLKTLRLALFKAQSEDKKKSTLFNFVDPSFFEECSLEEIEDLTASECYLKISKFYESYANAFDLYDKILLIIDKLFIDFTHRTPYSSFFFKNVKASLKFFKVNNFDALIIHKFLDLVTSRIRNQTWFKDIQPDDFHLDSWSKAAQTWDKHANSGLVKAFRNSYISNNIKKDVSKKEVDHPPIAPVGPSIASAQRAIFDDIYDYIMIDSGCKVNVLSKLTFDKLDQHTQSLCKFDDNITVKLPNSTNATCLGTIVLLFSCPFANINNIDITYCVFDFQWNLMGLDTCVEFKLLSKLESLLLNECAAIDVNTNNSDVSYIHNFLDDNPILYNDVITNSKITVNLPLPSSVTPFNALLIRFAKDLKSVSKDILDRDVEKGILRKVSDNEFSPWLSNAFTISQDGKKPRLVINPKHLNSQISIPSDIVRRLPTARDVFCLISKYYNSGKSNDYCFSSFDIQSAYHNCQLSSDRAKFLRLKQSMAYTNLKL